MHICKQNMTNKFSITVIVCDKIRSKCTFVTVDSREDLDIYIHFFNTAHAIAERRETVVNDEFDKLYDETRLKLSEKSRINLDEIVYHGNGCSLVSIIVTEYGENSVCSVYNI